ncbi:MAG: ABC transporter permease [Verrucomicrobiota bacterium]|nr:ABC transporter permease [Verrucomicrobiota bacterium]
MTSLPFELMLALRYLRPKRTFVSVITLISIIGVMLGVAVLIIVISVMSGFDKELRDKILGFSAHLRVSTHANRVDDWHPVSDLISKNPNVRAVAPYVIGQVLIETQPEVGEPAWIAQYVRGIDPLLETNVSILPRSVVAGEYNLRSDRILVGRTIANSLGIAPGDAVAIYSPRDLKKMKDSKDSEGQEARMADDYEVAGIFDVGYYEYNASFVVTSLREAQDLFDLEDSVNGLMVMLHDPMKADLVRTELGRTLGANAFITTWIDENSTFLDALVVEKNVMFYLLFFIMIVAAFGIMSALITFVVQKTREIGMLKALGATSGQIMLIFLGQSLMVGVIGVISGFCLGLLAVNYRNEFLAVMNRLTGFELFPAKIYNFAKLPALIDPTDIAIICGGSLLICLLAGLLPAWNAGRLKPVEALRHE